MSACLSARGQAAVRFDRYLVGNPTSAHCRQARPFAVEPMSDLIGIWAANRHRPAVVINRRLTDRPMSGLIGIWSAFRDLADDGMPQSGR